MDDYPICNGCRLSLTTVLVIGYGIVIFVTVSIGHFSSMTCLLGKIPGVAVGPVHQGVTFMRGLDIPRNNIYPL